MLELACVCSYPLQAFLLLLLKRQRQIFHPLLHSPEAHDS